MSYIRALREAVGHRPLIVASVGVLILDDHQRVLMHRRTDEGTWCILGGAVEPGETLEEAARREAQEESGRIVETLTPVDVFSGPEFFKQYPNGDQVYLVGVAFQAHEINATHAPDAEETLDLQFFALDSLPPQLEPISSLLLDRYRAKLARPCA